MWCVDVHTVLFRIDASSVQGVYSSNVWNERLFKMEMLCLTWPECDS
jgi:hypothetical protein